MSEYRTYVLGENDFTVGQNLEDIEITTVFDPDDWMKYTIKAKCGLDTPLSRILELMDMGMDFKLTLRDGKKVKLALVPIE